ncbi:hypothetical protein CCM_08863 [Cordyceps militaris CM01]|uniref:Uncharacterized protein n=1 Tax=Cordyceps militaris (strain CM01) TaxID=983644 RepID=G3JSB8_CORMM|nr:uncharacterized protein CCM_08863 [Cordyceps militaris CM01]EGX88817.1 hypothetical protein CCM_08863 [Cordyceps militaris CM01]
MSATDNIPVHENSYQSRRAPSYHHLDTTILSLFVHTSTYMAESVPGGSVLHLGRAILPVRRGLTKPPCSRSFSPLSPPRYGDWPIVYVPVIPIIVTF